MSYVAKTKILRGKTVVEPGSVIADLAADEIPALLAIRAIEPVKAASQSVKDSDKLESRKVDPETQDTDVRDASEADTATTSENGDQSAKADSKKAKGRK